MSQKQSIIHILQHDVETNNVVAVNEVHRFSQLNVDYSFPCIILTLCLRGSAKALYDMHEVTQYRNDLGIILPGHVMRPLECSEDYAFALMAVSQKMLEDLKTQVISYDYEKFHFAPMCTLTDVQAERLLTLLEQTALIASHTELELKHKYHILLAQLTVAYEMVNYYRAEQDKLWTENRKTAVFSQFCELVVKHYRQTKEVKFYAEMMHLHPKHLSRVIYSVTHGTLPKAWIEQYVAAQAKRLIETRPNSNLKEIAFMLGFNEPTTFYRYFKHATGITAKAYKRSVMG